MVVGGFKRPYTVQGLEWMCSPHLPALFSHRVDECCGAPLTAHNAVVRASVLRGEGEEEPLVHLRGRLSPNRARGGELLRTVHVRVQRKTSL